MQLWWNPYIELARIVSPRRNPLLTAHLKEHVQRLTKLRPQVLWCTPVEVSATIQAEDLPPEHVKLSVIFNLGLVALNGHDVHGTIPCCCSQGRILATAPLSVLGLGCGRWKTRTSPKSTTATRLPSRSLMSAPSSTKSASISRHWILALTGWAKMACRVLWCFLLM